MKIKKDDGVSNVVGELLLISVALILVIVFAASFFGVLPGERAEVIEFDEGSYDLSREDKIGFQFNFMWGDYLPASDLDVTVYDGDSSEPMSSVDYYVSDREQTERKDVLDFGNCIAIWIPKPEPSSHTYTFILSNPRGTMETKTLRVVIP